MPIQLQYPFYSLDDLSHAAEEEEEEEEEEGKKK
jgi:hypothetical protein